VEARAPSLVEVLLVFYLVLVVEIIIVVVVFFLFVFVEVVVVEIVVIVVGNFKLVGTSHHKALSAFGTAEGVTLLEVLGVNFVELTLRAGRHTGSMQRIGRLEGFRERAAPQRIYHIPAKISDYIGDLRIRATKPNDVTAR